MIVTGLDAGWSNDRIARVRERDRTPTEGLNDEEQCERQALDHDLFRLA